MRKGILVMALFSFLSLLGCGASPVSQLLKKLEQSTPEQTETLLKDLGALVQKNGSAQDIIEIIRAAEREYPKRKYDFQNTNVDLLRTLRSIDSSPYLTNLTSLSRSANPEVNSEVVYLLSSIDSDEACDAILDLLDYPEESRPKSLSLAGWKKATRHDRTIFPRLFEHLRNEQYSFEIELVTLAYAEAKKLDFTKIDTGKQLLLKRLEDVDSAVSRLQLKTAGANWQYAEDYAGPREEKALLLDIFGYLPLDDVATALQSGLDDRDPKLVYFSVSSLVRQGQRPDPRYFEEIAKDNEMRKWFYDRFKDSPILAKLDPSLFDQEELAVSDMVNWLIYPTELNSAPDQIELVKKIAIDTGSKTGAIDYFVFKFRTFEPHWAAKDGWMVGISGPFISSDEPTTASQGDTFSSFEKYDGRPAEDYLGNVQEIIESWKK